MARIGSMKNKENFLYSEKEIIKAFGKEYVMYLKTENYEEYRRLRNNPPIFPVDIILPNKNPPIPKERTIKRVK